MTAELGYTNRIVQMIEKGYDVGVVAGHLTDERLVARPMSTITRRAVAAPELVRRFRSAKEPNDLKSWPWAALSGRQFGSQANTVTFVGTNGGVRTLRIEPQLIWRGLSRAGGDGEWAWRRLLRRSRLEPSRVPPNAA